MTKEQFEQSLRLNSKITWLKEFMIEVNKDLERKHNDNNSYYISKWLNHKNKKEKFKSIMLIKCKKEAEVELQKLTKEFEKL